MASAIPAALQGWLWNAAIAITALCCLPYAKQLSWNRVAIAEGEYWRLLSGQFCHANFTHYAMNMLALAVIYWLFQPHFKQRRWITRVLFITGLGSISLFFTDYKDYVGFSGVLHGLIAYGALMDVYKRVPQGWLLLGGLVVKLAGEQLGLIKGSEALIKMPIAFDAHLYIALCGALVFAVEFGITHYRAQLSRPESTRADKP